MGTSPAVQIMTGMQIPLDVEDSSLDFTEPGAEHESLAIVDGPRTLVDICIKVHFLTSSMSQCTRSDDDALNTLVSVFGRHVLTTTTGACNGDSLG